MEDKSDSEVSSSMVSGGDGKEKPESTTNDGENGSTNLDFGDTEIQEPPTKSPKTESESDETSIEMGPEVSSTNSIETSPEAELNLVDSSSDAIALPESALNPQQLDKDSPISDGEEPMSISEPEVEVELRVVYNKKPMPVQISLKRTVGDLKRIIGKTTNVTPELMKVLVKGAKDDVTLESLSLTKGSKVIVIGTPLEEVIAVAKAPTAKELSGEDTTTTTPEPQNWCSVPRHTKVLDKGVPDDVMAGIREGQEPLPPFPLSGMLSAKGSKVRLTFKLETDELWIGTKERTEKVPISSIRSVTTQPIVGFEHYCIMAIQMGPTEASRFFLYWVPSQYVSAIKNALGA